MKNIFKKIVAFVVVGVIATMMATTVFAAGGKPPYKDVTVQSVGKDAFKAITYVKAHHGLDDVIQGKKMKPNKKIERIDFILILVNFYGIKNVPITETDIRKAHKPITADWACSKMVKVAEKLGMSITWTANKTKLTNASACQYVKVFADFSKLFKPRR